MPGEIAGRMIATEGSVASPSKNHPYFRGTRPARCDRDVARMMPRIAGAALGLLAFTIVLIGGLVAGNPTTVTLSRGVAALFLFFLIGLVLGTAAQWVIAEYENQRKDELCGRSDEEGGPGTARPESSGDPSAPLAT